MEWKPYTPADSKQEKEGVIVELGKPLIADPTQINTFPEGFRVVLQACNDRGQLLNDQGGPIMVPVSIARTGQLWQLMSLTNNTDHVLRLNQVAIRLFDPSGNQLEPLTKEDVAARLVNERPCSSSQQAVSRIRAIKIFDRNIEIVPGTTSSFWIPFSPPSIQMAGVWKYSIFDVPVQVDQAGRTLRATRFEIRTVATRMIDTYQQDSALAPPRLISSQEDPAYKATSAPAPSPMPSPSPPPPRSSPPQPQPGPPAVSPPGPTPPPVPPRKEAAPPQNTDAALTLVISVPQGNLRESGDPKAKILRTLPKNTRLTVLGKANQWYRVRLDDGIEGWVAESVTSAAR